MKHLILCIFLLSACDEAADCDDTTEAVAEWNPAEPFCGDVRCIMYAGGGAPLELCLMEEGVWQYWDAFDYGIFDAVDCSNAVLRNPDVHGMMGNLEVLSDGTLTLGGKGNRKPCMFHDMPYATKEALEAFRPGENWSNCPLH